ncbi:MAG: cytochrome bc complex cytochrome b subunit [Gemmatimonadota bacterium]|nr:cytochrome bc complex cytochrome b subunit [Gemmatimonadota bacterium]
MAGRLIRGLYDWIEDRMELSAAIEFARKQITKPVPKHVNWLFSFGTITFAFFITQAISGLLLMIYYEASASTAYDSIKFIIERVPFGWLIRQSHVYGANFMIAFLLLHVVRVFFYGGYKKPREVTWLFGFALLGITMMFGFTGYLLPWDQVSYWATVVGTEIAGTVPVVGEYTLLILRGGEIVSESTLTRFFTVHVIVLPWVFMLLGGGHLFLIRYQGISTLDSTDVPEPTSGELIRGGGKPFYPQHVLKEAIMVLLIIAAMILMIVYYPVPLDDRADPFNTPLGVKPEWYFLPLYQVLKFFPELIGIFGTGIVILALLLLPFWDRSPERHPGKRPVAVVVGILFLGFTIALGVLGHISETDQIIFGAKYHFDIYGLPQIIVEP